MNYSRIERVVKEMACRGLDRIIVSSPSSVYYLTNVWSEPGYRLMALVLEKNGDCMLYANRIFSLRGHTGDLPLVEFDDVDDSVAVLAQGLRPGVVGVDKLLTAQFLLRLIALRPDIRFTEGSAPVDAARMCKDAEELSRMRESSRLNDKAVELLAQTVAQGDTELALAKRYCDIALELGTSGTACSPLICFGASGGDAHHATDATQLRRGDAIIVDVGLKYRNATSDITRTYFYGSVSDEQKRVYEIVKAANEAGRKAVRPGVALKEIDRAARSIIEEAGYGACFTHRLGHGIGLQMHEPPDVNAVSEGIAKPGMVFSIEPGIYLRDRFGVRIEDLVAVTEEGHEVLNHLERELVILH